MPRNDEKELPKLPLHEDCSSVRSFPSSSSTLAYSPINHSSEEKNFNIQSDDTEAQAFPSAPTSAWRQRPLTAQALLDLLFLRVPWILLKPLLPSFLFISAPKKLHPTSYLDGLRGVAALIVFLDHFFLNWYYTLRNGYLSSPTDSYILQLPILRLIFAGRASVGVFFVISGFALSYKPLSKIRAGNQVAVLSALGSSVFRRNMRLYIPIIIGTFISANIAYNGFYTPVPSRGELLPPLLPTYREQLKHWWHHTTEIVFPFWPGGIDPNRPFGIPYNGHLWTIPIEFYGSMVVFLCVLATSRARNGCVRMGFLGGVAAWSLKRGRWDVFSFLGGVLIAEWSLICSSSKPTFSPEDANLLLSHEQRYEDVQDEPVPLASINFVQQRLRLNKFSKKLNLLVLMVSLYLLSYAGESPSPGIYHNILFRLAPEIYKQIFLGPEHYWLSIGSVLLVFTLANSVALQRPFTTRFAQYLGDLSYSLYIVHGMVAFTVGTYIQDKWTGQVGESRWIDNGWGQLVEGVVRTEVVGMEVGTWGFARACVLTAVLVFGLGLWAADVFSRVVDRGVVSFARWCECIFVGR